MGVVFAATHLALGHRVALKVVLAGGPVEAEFVARFEREARAVAMLTSPHVARVYDVGYLGPATPYMVMELLTGETLNKTIRRGPPHPRDVARFTREIGDALAEAHSLGIVHRDLKGDNVFLAQRPNGQISAKLLDFGISKVTNPALAGDGDALTNTRTFLGTPSSMAPEQFTGDGDVTPKTDVWSLGVLIFKMLTGASPFQAPSMFETAEKVVRGPTPVLAQYRPDLHPAWSALIDGALQKNPDHRPSLEVLLRRLDDAERLELGLAPAVAPPPGAPPPGAPYAVAPYAVASPVRAPETFDVATHTAVITSTSGASYSASSYREAERFRQMAGMDIAPPAASPSRRKAAFVGALAGTVFAAAGVFALVRYDAARGDAGRPLDEPRGTIPQTGPQAGPQAGVPSAAQAPVPGAFEPPAAVASAPALASAPAPVPTGTSRATHDASVAGGSRAEDHAAAPSTGTTARSRPRPPPASPPARGATPSERPSPTPPVSEKPKPLTNER